MSECHFCIVKQSRLEVRLLCIEFMIVLRTYTSTAKNINVFNWVFKNNRFLLNVEVSSFRKYSIFMALHRMQQGLNRPDSS